VVGVLRYRMRAARHLANRTVQSHLAYEHAALYLLDQRPLQEPTPPHGQAGLVHGVVVSMRRLRVIRQRWRAG
jgi:hypothetical protein